MSAQYPSDTEPPVPGGIRNMLPATGENPNGCDCTRSGLRSPTGSPLIVRKRSVKSSAKPFAQARRSAGVAPKNGESSRLEHSILISGTRTEVPARSAQERLADPPVVAPRNTTLSIPRSQRLAASGTATEAFHHSAVSEGRGGATAGVNAAAADEVGRRTQPTAVVRASQRDSALGRLFKSARGMRNLPAML